MLSPDERPVGEGENEEKESLEVGDDSINLPILALI